MNLKLRGDNMHFRQQRSGASPGRVFFLLSLIIGSLFIWRGIDQGQVKPLFAPTPTATRTSINHADEGQTHFQAGNLTAAIDAYKMALEQEPNNAALWSELARIQAYSSTMMTNDQDRYDRLREALDSATSATTAAPDDSMAHAVRSFVLDWYASTPLAASQSTKLLTEGEQEASRAVTLDKNNALAFAYTAEIQVDMQRWTQADSSIKMAMSLDKDKSLMDVYRVYAYVQESLGNYNESIQAYQQAAKITPNLTFLYNSIAKTYRHLRQYDRALEFYQTAVRINENLGVKDPIPYLGIGKTYTQMGEFFAASLNVRKALQFDPTSADVYAQLGIVYWHARNYEGSIPALKCGIKGCDEKTSCEVRKCNPETDQQLAIQGLPLTSSTVVYYYTYGSVLAAMHRKGDDLCNQAVQVLGEVRDGFGGDETIMSIVKASEDICASYGITR